MANQLIDDRMRLVRRGDENSATNRKTREAAFNIASAICKAFLTNSEERESSISLTDDYIINIGSIYIDRERCQGVSLTGSGNFGFPIYRASGDKMEPNNHMLSLAPTRCLAECIAHGWLLRVIEILQMRRGKNAAVKLAKELGLYCPQ